MAVKYAVANGNWSAGATWNDGVVPAVGDYVYLDAHTITIDVDVALGNGTISNGQNPNTTLSGGSLTMSATHTIVANLDVFAEMINSSGSGSRNFVGDITLHGVVTFINQSTNNTIGLSITGNVTTEGGTFVQRSSAGASIFNVTINGNISIVNTLLYSSRYTGEKNLVINGNLSLTNGGITVQNVYLTTFILSGSLSNIYGRNVLAVDAEVSGNITYASTTGGIGIFANSLTINNPDTFTWKDVTEPRSNPFIIVTNAEMNNRQQYPSENEVKQGTEYVWGEKVGTYQQPPESVVLKGYEYDTITAEENDIATYNLTRYIYADYGTLHWFELKTTTTDIVTTPSQQSITIGGETVVADTDYVVEYNDVCYQWSGSAWGSITTKNIGTVKTDILTNPTETMLGVKKGTLETTNLSQQLISRLENCATIETVQQLLVAHLDN